jgi:hypothetical protein
MTKPSDFFIGVLDFFAVLLAGASLVYLLLPLMVIGTPTVWLPATPTQAWVMFLVLAYIAGHLLHALGSCLLHRYVYVLPIPISIASRTSGEVDRRTCCSSETPRC